MYALLPQSLVTVKGASIELAGLVVGLGGLAIVGGVLAPTLLSRRASGSAHVPVWVWATAYLLPPALLVPAFAPGTPLAVSAALFIGLNVVSGAVAALMFAALPRFAGRSGMGAATGALAQAGATGSLLGPPLYALVVEGPGWTAAAIFGLAISVAGFALVTLAEREARTAA